MASPSKLARNGIIIAADKDFISNLPSLPTNMILELLPLSEAAKMSVLSKTWRNNWSCLKSFVFDEDFWKGQCDEDRKLDWQNYSSVISNILCHHNGSIHEFHLHIPKDVTITTKTFNLSPWICYLSTNDVKKITLIMNMKYPPLPLPSHIFSCKNLEELVLNHFVMKSPPAEFERFEHLRKLELISELAISVVRSKNVNVEHKFDHDNNFELGHLLEVRFKGLTGSRAELKLIEICASCLGCS